MTDLSSLILWLVFWRKVHLRIEAWLQIKKRGDGNLSLGKAPARKKVGRAGKEGEASQKTGMVNQQWCDVVNKRIEKG